LFSKARRTVIGLREVRGTSTLSRPFWLTSPIDGEELEKPACVPFGKLTVFDKHTPCAFFMAVCGHATSHITPGFSAVPFLRLFETEYYFSNIQERLVDKIEFIDDIML
jgi:hypothetical protein